MRSHRILLVEQPYTSTPLLLALEEALMAASSACRAPLAMVWWDRKSIVLGRTTRIEEEVRLPEARAWGVPLYRRKSGGGAVYHDPGNLNLTLAIPRRLSPREAAGLVVSIIIRALRILGLEAHVENEGDVVVGRRKVSGSAVYIGRNSTLAHATLLVSADVDVLRRVLVPRWDRVLRGEVTPSKYMPENISALRPGVNVARARLALHAALTTGAGVVSIDPWPGLLELAEDLAMLYLDEDWTYRGLLKPIKATPNPQLCPGWIHEYNH